MKRTLFILVFACSVMGAYAQYFPTPYVPSYGYGFIYTPSPYTQQLQMLHQWSNQIRQQSLQQMQMDFNSIMNGTYVPPITPPSTNYDGTSYNDSSRGERLRDQIDSQRKDIAKRQRDFDLNPTQGNANVLNSYKETLRTYERELNDLMR